MEFICRASIYAAWRPRSQPTQSRARAFRDIQDEEVHMADLVDIALPPLLKWPRRRRTHGSAQRDKRRARSRSSRDEAELAIEYLREWGFAARILEHPPGDQPSAARAA